MTQLPSQKLETEKVESSRSSVFSFVSGWRGFFSIIFFFVFIVAILYLRKIDYLTIENLISVLRFHPFLAPFLFILFYALMVVSLISTLALNLGAGFLWGPFWGGLISIIGASSGAALAFLISRYLAQDYLNNKFKGPTWLTLRGEIQKNNWKVVAFTRVNPIFPFGLVSYFFGLTPISFARYLWTTMVFMSPPAFLMAFLGYLIGGFVLKGKAYNAFYDFFIILFVLTMFIVLRFVLKKYFQINKNNIG